MSKTRSGTVGSTLHGRSRARGGTPWRGPLPARVHQTRSPRLTRPHGLRCACACLSRVTTRLLIRSRLCVSEVRLRIDTIGVAISIEATQHDQGSDGHDGPTALGRTAERGPVSARADRDHQGGETGGRPRRHRDFRSTAEGRRGVRTTPYGTVRRLSRTTPKPRSAPWSMKRSRPPRGHRARR